MPEAAAGLIMAFDYGLQHIGVATGQTITGSASGCATVRASNGKPRWRDITPLIEAYKPGLLVVGLPLNMDDSESELCDLARAFAAELQRRYGLPAQLQDERLTTRSAMDHLDAAREAGTARTDHELAACLIAEQYMHEAGRR